MMRWCDCVCCACVRMHHASATCSCLRRYELVPSFPFALEGRSEGSLLGRAHADVDVRMRCGDTSAPVMYLGSCGVLDLVGELLVGASLVGLHGHALTLELEVSDEGLVEFLPAAVGAGSQRAMRLWNRSPFPVQWSVINLTGKRRTVNTFSDPFHWSASGGVLLPFTAVQLVATFSAQESGEYHGSYAVSYSHEHSRTLNAGAPLRLPPLQVCRMIDV
jgi:hypothetical protein